MKTSRPVGISSDRLMVQVVQVDQVVHHLLAVHHPRRANNLVSLVRVRMMLVNLHEVIVVREADREAG
jgi:hypothetical protein